MRLMHGYVRPRIDAQEFLGADDAPIAYGERWPYTRPPEETYSVVTHPERFAPLHEVADAVVDFLTENYEVMLEHDSHVALDILYRGDDVLRAVRITPESPDSASVTIVYSTYPGLRAHIGLLQDAHFPVCGCDACDDTWQSEAERFERTIFAAVLGNYQERVTLAPKLRTFYQFEYENGGEGAEGEPSLAERDRAIAAASILERIGGHWAAWPRRHR